MFYCEKQFDYCYEQVLKSKCSSPAKVESDIPVRRELNRIIVGVMFIDSINFSKITDCDFRIKVKVHYLINQECAKTTHAHFLRGGFFESRVNEKQPKSNSSNK